MENINNGVFVTLTNYLVSFSYMLCLIAPLNHCWHCSMYITETLAPRHISANTREQPKSPLPQTRRHNN